MRLELSLVASGMKKLALVLRGDKGCIELRKEGTEYLSPDIIW